MYDSLLDHITCPDRIGTAFNLEVLPTDEAYKASTKAQAALGGGEKKPGAGGVGGAPGAGGRAAASNAAPDGGKAEAEQQKAAANAELMRVVSEIVPGGEIGPLAHSCRPKYITESEAEYTVQVIKHIFKQHVVLEMYVANTVPGIILENVEVQLAGLGENWKELGATAISRLENGQQASAHVVLAKSPNAAPETGAVTASFGAALRFIVKEDNDDVGFEDDYPVEKVSITVGDYMFARALPAGQFKSVWEQLAAAEAQDKVTLNFKTIDPAVTHLISVLNMQPCDNSAKVDADKPGHALLMSGSFMGNMVLVKALVGVIPGQNIIGVKIACRSKNPAVCPVVIRALMP